MGHMKDLDRRIRQGGDDAIAAACELSDLVKERRGYEDIENAEGDIIDIVTVLRGVGFAAVAPQAGDSASLLHYCVTHAADEIERLRNGATCPHVRGTVTQHCSLNFTLTDDERAAIEGVAGFLFGLSETGIKAGTCQVLREHEATLRSLLERLP